MYTPHNHQFVLLSVYAAPRGMTCVAAASLLGRRAERERAGRGRPECAGPGRQQIGAFRPRLLWYHVNLRQRHRLPVLPVVLFQQVGLDGIGEDEYVEAFGPLDVIRFRYLYVGFPRLEAEDYIGLPNPLAPGLAALMDVAEASQARIKAARRPAGLRPTRRPRSGPPATGCRWPGVGIQCRPRRLKSSPARLLSFGTSASWPFRRTFVAPLWPPRRSEATFR